MSRGREPRGLLVPLRRPDPSPDAMSDEALIAACAVGEPGALGLLFDRHHRAVFRFVARLAADADADDLVQTTFVEVWRGAARYRGGSAVRTWLLGIAANLVRRHVRGEVRRRAAMTSLAAAPPVLERAPDDAAIRRQLTRRLGEALAALPHDLRVAFVMCDLEEVPGVEAARALGLREGTLWRRLHDARKALRAALDGGAP